MATLKRVETVEPDRPSDVAAGIPRDLETICLKCLEKDWSKRYPRAEALANDLRRYLGGEPILARAVGRIERTVKWSRRRPAAAAAIVLAGLLAITIVAGALWHIRELQQFNAQLVQ